MQQTYPPKPWFDLETFVVLKYIEVTLCRRNTRDGDRPRGFRGHPELHFSLWYASRHAMIRTLVQNVLS